MSDDIKLPPMPSGCETYRIEGGFFSSRQMQEYARAAVLADRERRAQPVHDEHSIDSNEPADYHRGWKDGYKHGAWTAQPAQGTGAGALKATITEVLRKYTTEMEGYSYFSSNPGVPEHYYDDIADEIMAAHSAGKES